MLMRWKIASRRIPALFTTPSSLPKVSIAVLTILLAGIASATVSKFATAVPPRFLISSTTSSAGAALVPEPSAAPAGIIDHDLRAFRGTQQRDLAADAAPGAGNDDDFVLE